MTLSSIPALAWLVLSGVFFAGGEYLSKKYILEPKVLTILLMTCMYCLGSLAWLPALMQQKDLSVTGVLWSVISLCMTIGIGIFIFGEHVTPLRMLGIVLAIGSIVALSIGH